MRGGAIPGNGRKKGTPKTGGRLKGTPNKTTVELKAAILEAANRSGDAKGKGGTVGYLSWLAKTNSTSFSSLLGKVLPLQIAQASGANNELVVVLKHAPVDEDD